MTREDRASEIADYVEYLDALFDDGAGERGRRTAGASTSLDSRRAAATATRWVTHGRAPHQSSDSVGRSSAAGDRPLARDTRCAERA